MNKLELITLMLLSACAADLPGMAGGPADPQAKTPPIAEGSGVLGEGFDAERLAPAAEGHAAAHVHQHAQAEAPAAAAQYTCMHHPEVVSSGPGKCPKCGMDLVPKAPPPGSSKAPPEPTGGSR